MQDSLNHIICFQRFLGFSLLVFSAVFDRKPQVASVPPKKAISCDKKILFQFSKLAIPLFSPFPALAYPIGASL